MSLVKLRDHGLRLAFVKGLTGSGEEADSGIRYGTKAIFNHEKGYQVVTKKVGESKQPAELLQRIFLLGGQEGQTFVADYLKSLNGTSEAVTRKFIKIHAKQMGYTEHFARHVLAKPLKKVT